MELFEEQEPSALDMHDARINNVLREAAQAGRYEVHEDCTPAEELLKAVVEWDEGAPLVETPYLWPDKNEPKSIELHHLCQEEANRIAAHARRQLMLWLVGGGLHPFRIMQRFYAMSFAGFKEIVKGMSGRELFEMLGQGRASFEAVMSRLFEDKAVQVTGEKIKVAGQKHADSSAAYAANALQHKPKQRIAAREVKEEKPRLTGEQKRRLQRLREEAERRRLAALCGVDDPAKINLGMIKPKE